MTRLESDYYAYMEYDPENAKAGLSHYVPLFPHGPVLELACGRGEFLELLRDAGTQAQGVDGDEGMVEAARARGLAERTVVWHHAFKNALVPVITIIGLQIALLLGGAVLTEQTFNWPGIGSELIRYLNNRDYIAIQGIITFFALLVVAISLLIDLVNAWVAPRVRY